MIPVLLLGFAWFTGATWMRFSGAADRWWLMLLGALAVGFIPTALAGFNLDHPLLRAVYRLTALALGFLNFAFVAALACWLALGLVRLAGLPIAPRTIAAVLYGGAILATVAGVINAANVRVTRVTVDLPGLPGAWIGRDVVLVSDLHVGNVRSQRFVQRIVARLQRLKPAAVFIVGDMFDGAKVDVGAAVQPWADLRTPAGVFFVSGNHDEFSERAPYFAALGRTGVRVLHNERVDVAGLQIIGVHDGESHDAGLFRQILDRARIDRGRASILLSHRPVKLEIPEQAGVSLQLSGHTHGGQFWPWSLVVAKIYGRFAYGLSRQGSLQIFTSSGAGTWGPPLRVGTRSEIVLLHLRAEKKA